MIDKIRLSKDDVSFIKNVVNRDKLAKIRLLDNPVLIDGAITSVYANKNIILIERENSKQRSLLVFNNSNKAKQVKIAKGGKYKDVWNNKDISIDNGNIKIEALGFLILIQNK